MKVGSATAARASLCFSLGDLLVALFSAPLLSFARSADGLGTMRYSSGRLCGDETRGRGGGSVRAALRPCQREPRQPVSNELPLGLSSNPDRMTLQTTICCSHHDTLFPLFSSARTSREGHSSADNPKFRSTRPPRLALALGSALAPPS